MNKRTKLSYLQKNKEKNNNLGMKGNKNQRNIKSKRINSKIKIYIIIPYFNRFKNRK